MATHSAIAAVSRTLRTLLLDRMATGAGVTLAPPDVDVSGAGGARVNLYLMQVIENAGLKNQEIPGKGHAGAYGHPPLSLDLRYLMTTHSETEDQPDADLNAQTILGDAMRVFNDFGNRVDALAIVNPAAGLVGDPVLDGDLADEFERIKLVLHPASLDDITKVWSAVSGTNFRRSVVYEVTVVQIETRDARTRPLPVATRRILMTTRRQPEIVDIFATPVLPTDPLGETRVGIGESITIVAQDTLAERLYVRLGSLDPIRVTPAGDGRIQITVPDATYPADLDHPLPRPIPPAQQLAAGPLGVQLIAHHGVEGVQGGLGPGAAASTTRAYASNVALLQLCPRVLGVVPGAGNNATILRVNGQRLWHAHARTVEVIIGDTAIPVRFAPGDPWAPPSAVAVEVPISAAGGLIDLSPPSHRVVVDVDGARSRETAVIFTMGP